MSGAVERAALARAAQRIRARLGVWPAPAVTPSVWLAGEGAQRQAGDGDWVVLSAGQRSEALPSTSQNAIQQTARETGREAGGGLERAVEMRSDPGAAAVQASLDVRASALAQRGAAALAVDGRTVTLYSGVARYRFESRADLDPSAWLPALAEFGACGFAAPDAVALALAWRAGDETRSDDPWPVDLERFPRIAGAPGLPDDFGMRAPTRAFAPCPQRLGLYPVLPSAAWVERVLACGVRTVQLRVKDAEPAALRAEVERAVAAGRRYPDARVFINDHWQLALEAGAYGVHLGQEDLAVADLHALAQAGVRLGLSSHGYFEILLALQLKPSYLALGPIFATATKDVAAPPQGLARLARYARLAAPHAPLVAIGGIGAGNLAEVLAAGVGSAAVVSAVTGAADYRDSLEILQFPFKAL